MQASSAALARPSQAIPSVAAVRSTPVQPVQPSGPELRVDQAALLLTLAAAQLGLGEAEAARVREDGAMLLNDKMVTVIPLLADAPESGDALRMLITVDTGVPQGQAAALRMLQQTPGLLAGFSAAMGLSADGIWLLHSTISMAPDDPTTLADAIVSVFHLAEVVLEIAAAEAADAA